VCAMTAELIYAVVAKRLVRFEVEEVNLAAGKTTHWLETIGICAGDFLNDKAIHVRSSYGTAKKGSSVSAI
jgi:hypothetical protein